LRFLEFGENRRYITDRDGPDGASEPIALPLGFPVGSEIHTLAFVSMAYYFMCYILKAE